MRAAIALGSNLGDRVANIHSGIEGLRRLAARDAPFLVSRFYSTSPVDCPPGSDDFVNAAVELSPVLAPRDLLVALQAMEAILGRPTHRAQNAPRPIDLDIIYYGELQSADPALILPHPRARERRFVLAPLADIVPDLVLPGEAGSIRDLLASLPPDPTLKPL